MAIENPWSSSPTEAAIRCSLLPCYLLVASSLLVVAAPQRSGAPSAPVPFGTCRERPGVCPINDIISTCQLTSNSCTADNQCPRGLKCCSRGCNKECVAPCEPDCTKPDRCVQKPCHSLVCNPTCERYERPGICPINDIISICQITSNSCTSDNQCPSGLKCCSRGCNRECVPPCKEDCIDPGRCVLEPCYGGNCQPTCDQKCYFDEVPPSCENLQCNNSNGAKICVLQKVVCVRAPCYPVPVCVDNPCAAIRCGRGTVCRISEPIEPSERVQAACKPRAEPKPGFCPPKDQVSQSNVNQCEYDNDCHSDLICCPGASRDGLNCTAPVHPSPCACDECSGHPSGSTCAVRQGSSVCLDACKPGEYRCENNRQTYCSREARIVVTDEPCENK